MSPMGTTPATREILKALHDVDEEMSGYDLIQATGRPSGTIYPLLARMEADGLVARRTETQDEWVQAGANRPIRKYYLISPPGLAALNGDAPWPVAIDPPGCGCTECITGEYIPLDRATDQQVAALLRGEIHDNTNLAVEVTVVVRDEYGQFSRALDPALLGITLDTDTRSTQ